MWGSAWKCWAVPLKAAKCFFVWSGGRISCRQCGAVILVFVLFLSLLPPPLFPGELQFLLSASFAVRKLKSLITSELRRDRPARTSKIIKAPHSLTRGSGFGVTRWF